MDERQKEREYGFGRFWEYRNHIAYVLMGASLGFPKEDFEEQMTLEKAYDILRRGLPLSFDRIKDKETIPQVTTLLEASYAAFKSGNIQSGAHLLQDFEAKLLDLRRGRPKKAD
jgi:isopenicillin N synthase-like dioxygenase